MEALFSACFDILNRPFYVMGYKFSLFSVFVFCIVAEILGYFFGRTFK